MAEWGAFAGFAGVVLAALLFLAYLSQGTVSGDDTAGGGATAPTRPVVGDRPPGDPDGGDGDGTDGRDGARDRRSGDEAAAPPSVTVGAEADPRPHSEGADGPAHRQMRELGGRSEGDLSTGLLLLNVALSQGFLGGLLALGAWYTGVPLASLGLDPAAFAPPVLLAGAGVGVGLYAVNEVGAAVGEQFGLGGSEELRAALAPDSARGWVLLLGGVLPVIAAFEEFLFRGVLVGALAVGFGVSPWVLAGLSSAAFALGHGAQGPAGVAVTGALGFALAAAFVLTESLAAVVIAHYLVNALEFVVHEGLGVEPFGRGGAGTRGE